LPDYYIQALEEQAVDAIAPPEIEITGGQESGPIQFEAVVEIRPQVSVAGYGGLRVTIPSPAVTDEEVDRQLDRLREQFGELQTIARPARDGDHLSIDLSGYRHSEQIEGLTADDFLYELGSGSVVPELDEQLRGTKAGDILKFTAPVPGQEEDVGFQVLVKEVKEKILPDVTDEWASEASEFQNDLRESAVRAVQADLALRAVADAEGLDATDAELDAEIERIAQAAGQKPAAVRKQLDRNEQLPAVRSDIRKGKALAWLTEHV